ncbi:MAG: hypothetical protein FWC97_03055 [Treponema sp.]|nr:hypothetical protein [Treponema sp.]
MKKDKFSVSAKCGLITVFLAFAVLLSGCAEGLFGGGRQAGAGHDKIPDPGGDFTYDVVLVTFTEEASLLDKTWGPSDFPEFAFSEIRAEERPDNLELIIQLTGGWKRFMVFYLTEPSRDNVLRAIYHLQKRVEVHSVFPNGIATGGV